MSSVRVGMTLCPVCEKVVPIPPKGRQVYCTPACRSAHFFARNRDQMNAYAREKRKRYKQENPEYWKRKQRRDQLAQYGWDLEMYDVTYRAVEGRCPICLNTFPPEGRNGLVIDHCHKTGKVRGLLCMRCNAGLGNFNDDPEVVTRALLWLNPRALSDIVGGSAHGA